MTAARAAARFGGIEWLAMIVAVVIAHGFYWRIVHYPSDFDAQNYLDIATDIARNGLFSKFFYSNIRTYGYPLLLAILKQAAGTQEVWAWLIFESQLAAFVLAAVALRAAISRRSPEFARWSFVALVANPFVLSYTPETLSESVSLTLVVAAIACWLRARSVSRGLVWTVLAGSLLVSFSVMVRPANLFALAAWIVAVVLLMYEQRMRWRTAVPVLFVVVVGTALPMLPQYANNVRHYGEATPLVVARLGTNQQIWGIQYLKYATALPPVPLPSVFYDNPFARDRPLDPVHPLAWYVHFPGAGVATLALHVFNMLDQDLLFTYSRDLDPWYRVPVGILDHTLVALALVGILLLFANWKNRPVDCAALAVLVLAHLAVHAPTAVEMRFGLPLLALAGPLAAWTCLHALAVRSRAMTIAVMVFVLAYVTGALSLSDWVRKQSPSIVAWKEAHQPRNSSRASTNVVGTTITIASAAASHGATPAYSTSR